MRLCGSWPPWIRVAAEGYAEAGRRMHQRYHRFAVKQKNNKDILAEDSAQSSV